MVESTNRKLKLAAGAGISLSLVNTWSACVVSGQPKALAALNKAIEGISAPPDESQVRPLSLGRHHTQTVRQVAVLPGTVLYFFFRSVNLG